MYYAVVFALYKAICEACAFRQKNGSRSKRISLEKIKTLLKYYKNQQLGIKNDIQEELIAFIFLSYIMNL